MKNLSVYISLPLLVTALTVTGNVNAAFYVGGTYGYTKYEDLCDSVSGQAGATCDDEADGYKIFGGSRINPNLAFEAAYMDMGEATASTSVSNRTLGVTGLNFSVLGIMPLSKSFELFGKVGWMLWEAESKLTDVAGTSSTVTVDDSDINFGFGGNYIVNETFSLRAEFERFHNLSYDSSAETSVSFLSIGVVVSF